MSEQSNDSLIEQICYLRGKIGALEDHIRHDRMLLMVLARSKNQELKDRILASVRTWFEVEEQVQAEYRAIRRGETWGNVSLADLAGAAEQAKAAFLAECDAETREL